MAYRHLVLKYCLSVMLSFFPHPKPIPGPSHTSSQVTLPLALLSSLAATQSGAEVSTHLAVSQREPIDAGSCLGLTEKVVQQLGRRFLLSFL